MMIVGLLIWPVKKIGDSLERIVTFWDLEFLDGVNLKWVGEIFTVVLFFFKKMKNWLFLFNILLLELIQNAISFEMF